MKPTKCWILDATPASRQTLLFSATMPREIETLARRYQRDAIRIETLRRDEQHADIEYSAIRVAPNDVEHAVINILRFHEMRAALVFCSTREAVKRLHARLLDRGFSAVALSGELTQAERTQALQAVRDGRARVLVATDVAARGLDLPDLTLVIHADLPNDRDTLLHRSGRTGRAGKKGLCTLIVPFNKRRKADVLLAAAKVKVTWGNAPTADEIRARDQERFMADAIFTEAPTEEDQGLARNLQTARTADEIAMALIRLHRARLPAPEDLADDQGPPPRRDRDDRRGPHIERAGRERSGRERSSSDRPRPERARHDGPRPDRHERSGDRPHPADRAGAKGDRGPRPVHDDGRDMIWYHLNIGREKNADPRWLLPLICKAGGISKAEIGVIKIHDRETRFQIAADCAEQFDLSVRTNKNKEGHISRLGGRTAADDAAVGEALKALERPQTDKPAGKAKSAPHHGQAKSPAAIPATDAAPRPHAKAPWQDREKNKAGGKGFDKGPNKSPGKKPHRKGGFGKAFQNSAKPGSFKAKDRKAD
jgi:ATP-dependent RNA helicase DeaD